MINEEELVKQRKIGQQIMITRMILDESAKVSRGGFSFLDRSDIAKWGRISEKEVEAMLNDIAALDGFNICVDAALEYANELPGDAYGFFLSTYRKHGYHYVASILGIKNYFEFAFDETGILAKINADKIIDEGFDADEETQSAMRFEDSLKFYSRFYFSRIMDVVSEGYDWDVVSEMINEDDEFTKLLKSFVDKKLSKDKEAILKEGKAENKKKDCANCRYFELTRMASYCTKGFRKKQLEFGTEEGCKRWRAKANPLLL